MVKVHFEGWSYYCMESTVDRRKHANGLNIVAHGFATTAHDALVNFPNNGRRCVFTIHRFFSLVMNLANSKMVRHVLQVAVSRFGTDQTISRMIRQNQLNNCPPGIHRANGMRFHFHSFGYFGTTCRRQIPAAFDFNHANSAAARLVFNVHVVQLHVAQGWDINSNA